MMCETRDTREFQTHDPEKCHKTRHSRDAIALGKTGRNDKRQGTPRDIECMTFNKQYERRHTQSCNTSLQRIFHQNSKFDPRKTQRHGFQGPIDAACNVTPLHILVSFKSLGQKLSKLDAQAHRLAHHFEVRSVGPTSHLDNHFQSLRHRHIDDRF